MLGDALQKMSSKSLLGNSASFVGGSNVWNGSRKEEALVRMVYQERRAAVLRGELLHGVNSLAAVQTAEEVSVIMRNSILRLALIFVAYVVVAVLVVQPVEEWSVEDCAYFAVVTLTTVGYGDLSPSTPTGKVLSMLLSVTGLLTVSAALNHLVNILVKERQRQELEEQLRQLEDDTTKMAANDMDAKPRPSTIDAAVAADGAAATTAAAAGAGIRREGALASWLRGVLPVAVAVWVLDAPSALIASARIRLARAMAAASERLRLRATAARVHAFMLAYLSPEAVQWLDRARRAAWWTFDASMPLLASISFMTLLGFCLEDWGFLDSVYFALISILTVGYVGTAHDPDSGRYLWLLHL